MKRMILVSVVALAGLTLGLTSAHADSPIVGAEAEMWLDYDGDGIFGTNTDILLDSTLTGQGGEYSLSPPGFGGEGGGTAVLVEPPGFGGAGGGTLGGIIGDDQGPLSGASAELWGDANENGVFGDSGDVLLDSDTTSGDGEFVLSPPAFGGEGGGTLSDMAVVLMTPPGFGGAGGGTVQGAVYYAD